MGFSSRATKGFLLHPSVWLDRITYRIAYKWLLASLLLRRSSWRLGIFAKALGEEHPNAPLINALSRPTRPKTAERFKGKPHPGPLSLHTCIFDITSRHGPFNQKSTRIRKCSMIAVTILEEMIHILLLPTQSHNLPSINQTFNAASLPLNNRLVLGTQQ